MANENIKKPPRPKSQKVHKPVILDEDNVHYKGKPPYIMIGILAFIILYGFWNVYITEKREQRSSAAVEKTE